MQLVSREGNVSELSVSSVATCSILSLWFNPLYALGFLQISGDPWSSVHIYEEKIELIKMDTNACIILC